MDGARLATEADLPVITELARGAVDELAVLRGGSVWQRQLARREPIDVGLAAELSAGPGAGALVVGTIDDAVVGYAASRLEELADGTVLSVISDLYVLPDARGVGVGEAMMGVVVDHARSAGAVGVDSLALPGDRQTKNFFESFGLKARAIVVHRSFEDEDGDEDAPA